MLKHHKKLRELSLNLRTGEVDGRKLKSKKFREEFMRVILEVVKTDKKLDVSWL